MDSKQNKQIIRQAYDMYMRKDIEGILALLDDKVEWTGYDSDYIPFAGTHHGKDQVAQFFSKLEQAQEALRFEPAQFIAEDDKVAVTGTASYHVKATGKDYDSPWAHVFTVRDGKIVRFQQFNHTGAAETAYRPGQAAGVSGQRPAQH